MDLCSQKDLEHLDVPGPSLITGGVFFGGSSLRIEGALGADVPRTVNLVFCTSPVALQTTCDFSYEG